MAERVFVGGRCSRGSEARTRLRDYRLLYAWLRGWGIVMNVRAAEAMAIRCARKRRKTF